VAVVLGDGSAGHHPVGAQQRNELLDEAVLHQAADCKSREALREG
jgi:hypothetical protein